MVVGSVLTASPPYTVQSARSELLGYTPTATYCMQRSRSFVQNPNPGKCATLAKSYDSTLPCIAPLRSAATMPWRPSVYAQTARPSTSQCQAPLSKSSELIRIDDFKVPQVFSSARNSLYTRYTPSDWSATQRQHYLTSDKFRSLSESLRLDSLRLTRQTEDRTRTNQHEAGKRLGERFNDIEFWRQEVNHEIDYMVTETNQLAEIKRQLERALLETENPLQVAQECLYVREKRQGIDLVHDDVERELLAEVDAIKRCQDELRRAIDRANTQLAMNRAAQHELEKDTSDKVMAANLDEQCRDLTNKSRGIAFRVGIENIDRTVSVPESWAQFTNNNIQRSQAQRGASKQLRDEAQQLLARTHQCMWTHFNHVNVSFTRRIAETADAQHKTEEHLQKVLQEIFDMEKNIELLKRGIADKEAPLQVAQTRLDTRTRRPNIEGCRDPAQLKLVSEVNEIYSSVDHLQAKLRESEAALQHLLNTKLGLEDELARKTNSLFLDREKCMGIRKSFPLAPRF